MKYMSTRGGIEPIPFSDAVMMGLATDGGLILPAEIPDVTRHIDAWKRMDYPDLAFEVMSRYIGNDISKSELRAIIDESYSTFSDKRVAPVIPLDGYYLMELFHGPTLAFKDIALQFLGNLFAHILDHRQENLNILGATSGDTGSAAIAGIRGKKRINIFILHPHRRVSPIQERQMTTVLDDNVFNIAIDGSFDDGQRIIKELFNDIGFKSKYRLGAVNSVNWARILAQIVYYFYGAFRVLAKTGKKRVNICVPSGNFGNIFAGYLARKMGAPIETLILATNENDILSRFFQTGVYGKDTVRETYSPSMDIQIASNFERYLFYYLGEDCERLRSTMIEFEKTGVITMKPGESAPVDTAIVAGSGSNAVTLETIKSCYDKSGYTLDPHTAVGVAVAKKIGAKELPTLCLATAHPAKFADTVKLASGFEAPSHEMIAGLEHLPTRCTLLPANTAEVRSFIRSQLGI